MKVNHENLVSVPKYAKMKGLHHQRCYQMINEVNSKGKPRLVVHVIGGKKFVDKNFVVEK